MITHSQITEIRSVTRDPNIEKLLKKWENELRAKEIASSSDKFEITLKAARGDATATVIAQKLGENFCVHKSAFGLKGMSITHINSQLMAFCGTKDKINAFITEFTNHPKFKDMDEAWKDFERDGAPTLTDLQNEFLNLCRKHRDSK